ncbi:glycerol uptake facilitator-like aquaporin [Rhodovulum imhoffii]|uniref:Glycerol uptake facilitator-like aquaporin n=1 Tax=Rhodovulum imhoffii TaxID=365340 RepID=A0A2T5BTI2_9RHOB|nr:MIP/aquaporin family protein [Rhodovulum imhoffii]MBK5934305.1 aquaporin family protein [Rhodovulum imhoffii]PTN02747.1 glycerol uptake facilitator-like aquaporin [Rhodovulum imhoffii]
MTFSHSRRLAAEALGTGALVAGVVGSGIMADGLTGDVGLALLANTIATGAILAVLITVLAPVSGAHFNPVVSLVFALRKELRATEALGYVGVQVGGGVLGCFLAHAMFDLPVFQAGTTLRGGSGQWLAEIVATFGLVGTILAAVRFRPQAVGGLVGLYIAAAYWFTSSTSFANPAVTIARALTQSFAGIRPIDVLPFVSMQILGALLALGVFGWVLRENESPRRGA